MEKTQPTPPVGSVAEVTAAFNMLRRFDRQLQAAPHDMAVWIVRCLAVQFADAFRKPQDSRSGMSAIMGKWPGDETDDEIKAGLEDGS